LNTLTVTQSGGSTFSSALNAASVVLTDTTGTVAFEGDTTITTGLTTANAGYNVSFTGSSNSIAGDTSFLNTGSVTLGDDAGDSTTFVGGVNTTGAVSNPGSVSVQGTVQTTDTQADFGALTVAADATLATGTGALNVGAVTLADGSTLTLGTGGAGAIGVTSLTGTAGGTVSNVTVNNTGTFSTGAVGTDIGTVTVTQSGGSTFSSTLNAASVVLTDTTGTISFADDLTVGTGMSVAGQGFNVSMTGGTNSIAGATTFANTGTLTIGDAASDSTSFDAGLTATAPGSVNLAGNVLTTNANATFGTVNLTAATTIDTDNAAGNISFVGAINGGQTLTLDAGTGTIAADGNIGAATALSGLTVNAASQLDLQNVSTVGAISLTATNIDLNGSAYSSEDGAITMTGQVDLERTGSVTLNSDADNDATDGNITIAGSVTDDAAGDSGFILDADTGAVSISSDIGTTSTELSSLAITTSGQVDLGNVYTTGAIDLSNASGNINLNGATYRADEDADIRFGGSVNLATTTTVSNNTGGDGSNSGTISFTSIDGAVGLVINGAETTAANSGTISITGTIGGSAPLTSLDIDGGSVSVAAINTTNGLVDISADSISASGAIATTGGNVLLSSATGLTLSNASSITTTHSSAGAASGSVDIDVTGVGDITIDGDIDSSGIDGGAATGGAAGQVDINTFDGAITVAGINADGGAGTTTTGVAAVINIVTGDNGSDSSHDVTIGGTLSAQRAGLTGETITITADRNILDGNSSGSDIQAGAAVLAA